RYERIAVLGRLRGVVMREIKLTSLVFLAGLAIAACSSSDDGDDEATGTGGSGVGAMPGTGGGTTDPGTGGGTTDPGSGGSTSASTCEGNVVKATGSPALIDDFEGDPADGLPENDGRAGEWHFGSYADTSGPLAVRDEEDGNNFMRFSMENTGIE